MSLVKDYLNISTKKDYISNVIKGTLFYVKMIPFLNTKETIRLARTTQ